MFLAGLCRSLPAPVPSTASPSFRFAPLHAMRCLRASTSLFAPPAGRPSAADCIFFFLPIHAACALQVCSCKTAAKRKKLALRITVWCLLASQSRSQPSGGMARGGVADCHCLLPCTTCPALRETQHKTVIAAAATKPQRRFCCSQARHCSHKTDPS